MLGLTRQGCHQTFSTLLLPFLGLPDPQMSPIEHIWDHLGRQVGYPPSLNELKARLQQIWNVMSQGIIQSLYASMPDRIASYIRTRGGLTGQLERLRFFFGAIFQQDNAWTHTTRVSPDFLHTVTTLPWPAQSSDVSNRAYLGSFGTASWVPPEFERIKGKVTANMERNVSRHYTELVCFNARSYCIVHSH
ncbi:uncharacterized protein TNCV_2088961 [Trichonephila clavipes]|nr:uncharacterized protein TNCV_2088961 [Trichonephila clavipes]